MFLHKRTMLNKSNPHHWMKNKERVIHRGISKNSSRWSSYNCFEGRPDQDGNRTDVGTKYMIDSYLEEGGVV